MPGAGMYRRVLFVRTDRLGETLLTLPAAAALKHALPNASLTLLVQADLEPLLVSAQGVDRVITDDLPAGPWWRRAIRLGQRLRPHRFDLVIVSNPKKELHAAAWLAGIPCRVGYGRKWGWLLTHRLQDRKALGERHEVEYNLDLIQALGLPTSVPEWHFSRFTREQTEVFQLLERQGVDSSRPFIAVHPWTSNPAKAWPAERYRVVIQQAVASLGVQVVVIGGVGEEQRALSLVPEGRAVANLVGRLSLRQLAALLQGAQLLVSNDSGPVHLAVAVNTKTLVLFGTSNRATGPGRWGPWGSGHAVMWKPSMDAISVDEVCVTLQHVLQESRAR